MATGDQSGSWGTVTNTNLELIAEAFSFGTEAITTNADTHTTTIADGGTDPGRSMFLKYTGTLDSACTITIGPNTVSKLWFIENATSGSQNIIIKQGSGATVTIASGKTKVIYSDGVGSAAKMVDAFAALDVGSMSVDNITIDGTTIALSSGDLTLDVAGDIILDADGSNVFFKKAGTSFYSINEVNGNAYVGTAQSDKDLYIRGNDGGTEITALLFDMSAAGAATFNSTVTANNGINVDNINIDGTTIALSSGNLTLDVAGELNIDVDGGAINYKDGGTHFASLEKTGDSLRLETKISDGDIEFRGNDGGATINALTLDMSDAGTAIFNHDIKMPDSGQILIGAGSDIVITHDNSNGKIENNTGNLTLDVAGDIILDADGGDITLKDGGVEFAHLSNSSTDFVISTAVADKDIKFLGNDGGTGITALTLDMSAAGAATFNNDVTAFSDERLKSNITTIPDALSKVTEMRGVHYVRDATGKDSTGVIAQEMQKVAPELVLTADDEMGTLSVNYGNITGYLIEAIKELKAEIEELKAR